MKRCYFALFNLPKPQREHIRIVDVIRAASDGDFKQFVVSGGIAFVYESEHMPWDLSFSQILHTGDSKIIIEIGENLQIDGFGSAAGWLNAKRPRRQ